MLPLPELNTPLCYLYLIIDIVILPLPSLINIVILPLPEL